MFFSVLIANYNNAQYLDAAIQSVMNQTYNDWEIILLDDGSKDEFETVIKRYQSDERIKIFRNGVNHGCSFTKNKLIELATGDLLGFLDPDDSLHPEALEIMANLHSQMPLHSIIHSTHYICDSNLQVVKTATYPKALPPDTPYLLLNDGSIHAFASFKKNLYMLTEGISFYRKEDRAVDQDLYYRLEEAGPVFFVDKPLYYYRIHSGSISNWGNEAKAMVCHYRIIEAACLRRLEKLKSNTEPDAGSMAKRYRTRYHKIRMLRSYRQKHWGSLLSSAFQFPIVGGMDNIISYMKKLPAGGFAIIRKSLTGNYQVLEKQ